MRLLLLTAFSFFTFHGLGQKYAIAGVITDTAGMPIPHATVFIRYDNATITNKNGEFSMTAMKGDIIRFTRIGYGSFKYIVKEGSIMHIWLKRVTYEIKMVPGLFGRKVIGLHATVGDSGKIVKETLLSDPIFEPPKTGPVEDPNKVFEKLEIEPTLSPMESGYFFKKLLAGIKLKHKHMGRFKAGFFIGPGTADPVIFNSIDRDIDKTIVENIQKLRGQPAIQNGRTVPVYCEISFMIKKEKGALIFTLQDD